MKGLTTKQEESSWEGGSSFSFSISSLLPQFFGGRPFKFASPPVQVPPSTTKGRFFLVVVLVFFSGVAGDCGFLLRLFFRYLPPCSLGPFPEPCSAPLGLRLGGT